MDQKQKKTQKLIFKRVMQEWRKKKPYIRPSFNQKKVQTCKLDWLSNSDEKEILLCMWDLKLDIFKREFLKHNKFVPLHLRKFPEKNEQKKFTLCKKLLPFLNDIFVYIKEE